MKPHPTMEVAGPARIHLPALDGLRGLAILLVLVSHLMLFNDRTGSRLGDSLAALRGLGWTGVDLFFVLSGFLITGILYDTLQDPRYFRSFYMRRFLRIFPLYYGFLLFMVLLAHWQHFSWGGRQYVLLAYLQNTGLWFPVTDFHPGALADLDHFWSLAVEEQFYVFWPLLVFLVRGRSRLIALTLSLSAAAVLLRIALYLHGASPLAIFMSTPCRMDTLLMGGCVALVARGESDWIPRRWMLPLALTSAVVIAAYTLAHPHRDMRAGFFGATFGYSVIAIGCVALLIAALDRNSPIQRVLSGRVLRSLGKYSYGIYVLHIFISHLFGTLLQRVLGQSLRNFLTPVLHSHPLAVMVEFCLNLAVVFGAAYVSYHLYELHFLRLKRYFGYRKQAENRLAVSSTPVPLT
ncbi:MAG TPA: acyltransferase [Acidobacteriaceae bacterium]|nr:acyltransferase [Acidobacteriaceae bacterium]